MSMLNSLMQSCLTIPFADDRGHSCRLPKLRRNPWLYSSKDKTAWHGLVLYANCETIAPKQFAIIQWLFPLALLVPLSVVAFVLPIPSIVRVILIFFLLTFGVIQLLTTKTMRRLVQRNSSLFAGYPINWCLVCRYDLAGLPTESDGCVVCPECGAAWDLPISAKKLAKRPGWGEWVEKK